MKSVLLAFTFLLGTGWTFAQSTAAPDQEGSSHRSYPEGSEQTVNGCLGKSNGKYVLTRKDVTSFELTGGTSKLSNHVGQEVKVTGMVVAKSGTNGTEEGTGTGGTVITLRVNSIKQIAGTCPNGEDIMMPK